MHLDGAHRVAKVHHVRRVATGSCGLLPLDKLQLAAPVTVADAVGVRLPDADSRLLTRELFYTAVTRAKARVVVVGSEAAVRAAVDTTAQRATGLRQRLA